MLCYLIENTDCHTGVKFSSSIQCGGQVVLAAAEGLFLVSFGGGEIDFGGSVGGDEDIPHKAVAFAFPATLNKA